MLLALGASRAIDRIFKNKIAVSSNFQLLFEDDFLFSFFNQCCLFLLKANDIMEKVSCDSSKSTVKRDNH